MNGRLQFLFVALLAVRADVACSATIEKADARAAGSRQALLIANADYPDADVPLRHPIEDARAIADELRRTGFEVTMGENLTSQSMQNALSDFRARIRPGSAALIFFSGYGVQISRQNYLIPINAQIWSEADVRRDGIALESILTDMDKGGARVKLVIIDASRENPFERRFRGSSAGLASIDASQGTLVVYAAAPDKVIIDGGGENSLFVSELVKEIRSRGQTAKQLFLSAGRSVSRASGGQQLPWLSSSPAEDFYFVDRLFAAESLQEGKEPSQPAPNEIEPEIRDCPLTEPPPVKQALNHFLADPARGHCPELARGELAKLKDTTSAKPLVAERPVDERAIGDPPDADRMAAFLPRGAVVGQSESEAPPLLVQRSQWMSGEPVPLGLILKGRADGAVVMVTGLVPGMTLSTGNAVNASGWQVPAKDLANTRIAPPEHFVGAVDLVAELRLDDTTVAYRQPTHIEWVAPRDVDSPQLSAVAPVPEAVAAPHQLDQDEIAMLVERGKKLLANGDVAAARLVLERAAESKHAEAALILAATYDPFVLRELKVYGIPADVATARVWYEKAKKLGSTDASRRLEVLAKSPP